jgi:hypothetical protein
MTLLDYYTAGTVEYFSLLFTTLFGILSLYILARDHVYRKHLKLLTSVYCFLSLVAFWVGSRLIGTAVLIYLQLQANNYWSTYVSQATEYDPLGLTRFVPLVVNTPLYYVLYIGLPAVVALFLIQMWYQMVLKEFRNP